MTKFKEGDKVRFVKELHSKDYTRIYNPFDFVEGVVGEYHPMVNEYEVIFGDKDDPTWCFPDELELIRPKEPIITMGYDGVHIKAKMKDGLRITDLYPNMIKTEYYDRYVKGVWNIDMKNEVLELWYARKHNKIMKEYEEKEREFNNSKELVIKYKDIIGRFEKELEELYISEENVEKGYVVENLSESMYQYNIDYDKLNNEFIEEYVIERDNKLHELDELRKEINAQLSLSADLEYQLDVLSRYGVLNKKTKKMVD